MEISCDIFNREICSVSNFKSSAQLPQAIEVRHSLPPSINPLAQCVWREREVKGAQLRNTIVNLQNWTYYLPNAVMRALASAACGKSAWVAKAFLKAAAAFPLFPVS